MLVGAAPGFRFLCGVCWRNGREREVYIDHGDRVEALAWEYTSRFKCRSCPADYNRHFGKLKARVRLACQYGRRELILGEDL